ncbi:hypothetical protein EAH89_25565 [Roseomonas nepalensis]|uniref:Uncharacterized protein n=1 Tax=Muricoccus nepalensis TaxID=1854500 RepID=A0A502F9L8_9PROT|nr:hypothetical protein [Roseomonas nepalensis]TPG45994.1 hypothetical protein EAH89_25565 [Roseomonas nepalensis]
MPHDQSPDLDTVDQLRGKEPEAQFETPEPWETGIPAEEPVNQLLPPEDSIILRRAAEGVDRLQALLDEEEGEGESPIDTMLRLLEEMLATQKVIVEIARLHREETAALGLRLSALEARLPSKTAAAPSTASKALPATPEELPSDSSEVH